MDPFQQWADANYEKLEELFDKHIQQLKESGLELPFKMETAEFDFAAYIYDNYVLGVPIDEDGAPVVYEELNSEDEAILAHECEEEPDVDDESDDDPAQAYDADEDGVDDDPDDDEISDELDDDAGGDDAGGVEGVGENDDDEEAEEVDESEVDEAAERELFRRRAADAA